MRRPASTARPDRAGTPRLFLLLLFVCAQTLLGQVPKDRTAPQDSREAPAQTAQETVTLDAIMARQSILGHVPDDTRPIKAGDILSFQVFEDEDPVRFLRVNENGTADFPFVGLVQVQGNTCRAVAAILKEKLEEEFYYQATVFIAIEQANPVRGTFVITGEVNRAGEYAIPAGPPYPISKAILAAGNFGAMADRRTVKIQRKGQNEPITVDLRRVFSHGENDIAVEPDDRIFVNKAFLILQ